MAYLPWPCWINSPNCTFGKYLLHALQVVVAIWLKFRVVSLNRFRMQFAKIIPRIIRKFHRFDQHVHLCVEYIASLRRYHQSSFIFSLQKTTRQPLNHSSFHSELRSDRAVDPKKSPWTPNGNKMHYKCNKSLVRSSVFELMFRNALINSCNKEMHSANGRKKKNPNNGAFSDLEKV